MLNISDLEAKTYQLFEINLEVNLKAILTDSHYCNNLLNSKV